jgi:hypothetical protein
VRTRLRRAWRIFLLGAVLSTLVAFAYIEWGRWGRMPMKSLSRPDARWARILYAPGLSVGRDVFRENLLALGPSAAKRRAGMIGIGLNAVLHGTALAALVFLLPPGKRARGR